MSPIKGLTEQRRMPRIGKLHLGIKKKNKAGVEYPTATDYFVYPEEGSQGYDLIDQLKATYGEKPKSLNIVFAMPDEELVASQYYRCYQRTRGLVCRGDGETCNRVIDTANGDLPNKETTDTELREMDCTGRDCPDYTGRAGCREVMNLQFMLPEISGLGIWQVDTGSINSIRNINSCLEAIRAVYKRIDMIPLTLTLEKMEVTPPGEKKKTVHVMNIRSQDSLTEALVKAQKPAWQLIAHDPVKAEEDKSLWPEDPPNTQAVVVKDFPKEEQERMLTPEEAENRLTPDEIEEAIEEEEGEDIFEPDPETIGEELKKEAEDKDRVLNEAEQKELNELCQTNDMGGTALLKWCNDPKRKWGVEVFRTDLRLWMFDEIKEAFRAGE